MKSNGRGNVYEQITGEYLLSLCHALLVDRGDHPFLYSGQRLAVCDNIHL